MRIAFVIPSLGAGGAERVATLLANEWNANGHDVTLVTFDAPGTEPFFALDPWRFPPRARGLCVPAGCRQSSAPILPACRGSGPRCGSFIPMSSSPS